MTSTRRTPAPPAHAEIAGVDELISGCTLVPGPDAVRGLLCAATPPVSLWGVGVNAPIHLGLDDLIVRQKALTSLGARHLVLLADYHSLITHQLTLHEAGRRADYYERYLRHCCGLKATYVRASEFVTHSDYAEALYALLNRVRESEMKRHMPQGLRKTVTAGTSSVSAYVYMVMQWLDARFLGADLVFADAGQRKVYELLDSVDLDGALRAAGVPRWRSPLDPQRVPAAIYAPLGWDIRGLPLQDSTAATRISIHETPESLQHKIRRMHAPPAGQAPTGRMDVLLSTFRSSVFPWTDEPVEVGRRGRPALLFHDHTALTTAYHNGEVHPADCKESLTVHLWRRLSAVQAAWPQLPTWLDHDRAVGLPAREEEPTGRGSR